MVGITGNSPSLRSQWLGEKLRELRKHSGYSLRYVGDYLQRDPATLSRNENGELTVRRGDLLALMDLYGVSDERERAALEQLREEAWRKGWWDQHREDLGNDFINVPWLESRADRICKYHNMLVEGLLQTREYAETLIRYADPDEPEDQIQRWVDLRMDRQRILQGEAPARLAVILEEAVFHRPIGTRAVWGGQLEHLLGEGQRENVEVRVIPFSAAPHAGHEGSFMLFEMPEPYLQVAHLDTPAGQLFIEEPAVHRFSYVWKDLTRKALGPGESAQLIARHLEEI
ncbi:MAG TPA: helix-turn-helix transcriptional regulator [Glycomyces sp.]|nr:helix-turn-helix transcriptional regulator [Glycomyces sp.]